jgi:hypothetical protein
MHVGQPRKKRFTRKVVHFRTGGDLGGLKGSDSLYPFTTDYQGAVFDDGAAVSVNDDSVSKRDRPGRLGGRRGREDQQDKKIFHCINLP